MTQYTNIPPKDIQNVIWGCCFDYEDFDTTIDGITVRDRIYICWQNLETILKSTIENNERLETRD